MSSADNTTFDDERRQAQSRPPSERKTETEEHTRGEIQALRSKLEKQRWALRLW